MYGKSSYRKRRPAVKKARRVSRKSSSSRKSITKIVKSVISRQAENKVWADYGVNQSIVCTIGAVPASKNLLPLLSQGVGAANRIGNEIRVKSGYIRGHVNLLPAGTDSASNILPAYVKMWVISSRQINTQNLSATNIATNFFEIGGASGGFQGNMLDVDFSPNKDSWIIHATKTCKLGVGASSVNVNTTSYFDNSPFSVPFQFNFGKKLTTLKYDEAVTNATNRNLFIVFQVVPANGNTGAFNLAEYHYTTRVEYEDM